MTRDIDYQCNYCMTHDIEYQCNHCTMTRDIEYQCDQCEENNLKNLVQCTLSILKTVHLTIKKMKAL